MADTVQKPCGSVYPRRRIIKDKNEGEMHARIKKEKEDAEQQLQEEP